MSLAGGVGASLGTCRRPRAGRQASAPLLARRRALPPRAARPLGAAAPDPGRAGRGGLGGPSRRWPSGSPRWATSCARSRGRAALPARRGRTSCGRSRVRWPTSGCSSSARTRTRPRAMPMGLSFSRRPGRAPAPAAAWPTSTASCTTDLGLPPRRRRPDAWADQGVLLLNRVLTVAPRSAGSHRGQGWEEVTEHAIRALVARDRPLVAILWGRDAQALRAAARRHPVDRVGAPEPDVGGSRVLRLASRSAGPTRRSLRRAPIRSTGACPEPLPHSAI